MDERSRIVTDVVQLTNHLQYNHLVQAHAVQQRLEALFKETIINECNAEKKAEDHKYWMPLKNVIVVKSMILSGKTNDALGFAQKIMELL